MKMKNKMVFLKYGLTTVETDDGIIENDYLLKCSSFSRILWGFLNCWNLLKCVVPENLLEVSKER